MSKKIKKQKTIKMNGESHSFEVGFSLTNGHTNYSGFGPHAGKMKKAQRRENEREHRQLRNRIYE